MNATETSKDMKKFYIEAIVKMMEKCNDLPLLDLIYRLMRKSV